jgi:hypothetical protein
LSAPRPTPETDDALLAGVIDWPTVADIPRLVARIRAQNREIAHLRGACEKIAAAAIEGHGPAWIEDFARAALAKDFRLD